MPSHSSDQPASRPQGSPPPHANRLRYRSVHRMRSHQEAHAQGGLDDLPPIMAHPQVAGEEPSLVSQQSELVALVEQLRKTGCFAYDSEFIGEHSYYPHFCVIQVATTEQVTLIDALGEVNLMPFWELLADADVLKLVHAGTQDLEPVWRHVGRGPANVIDTQVAVGFMGLDYPMSLSRVVERVLEVRLHPGAKFSQWDRRPLTAVQKRYAADDVRYLPLLWERIRPRLEQLGHLAWVKQTCEQQCEQENLRISPETQRLRVGGLERLTRRQTMVLRALVAWRAQLAREKNLPPRVLIDDTVLAAVAKQKPTQPDQVQQMRGLPRAVKQHHVDDLLAVVQEARQKPLAPAPAKSPAPSPQEKEFINLTYQTLQQACEQRQIAINLVASKKTLARVLRRGWDEQDPIIAPLATTWRKAVIDPVIRKLAEPE